MAFTTQLAPAFRVRELLGDCISYASKHFSECTVNGCFLNMPQKLLKQLMQSDLIEAPEEEVLDALLRWAAHDFQRAAGALESLLPLIRWAHITDAVRSGRCEDLDILLQQISKAPFINAMQPTSVDLIKPDAEVNCSTEQRSLDNLTDPEHGLVRRLLHECSLEFRASDQAARYEFWLRYVSMHD